MTGLDFGEELRRYRTAAGLTLRSLAEQIMFDFSYLAQVERGERFGSVRLARRCDTALGAHGHLLGLFIDHKEEARQSRLEERRRRMRMRITGLGDPVPPP